LVETGTKVALAAAANLKAAILELGGKSAAIVMPDADLDVVMESVRRGIFYNAGQVCSAMLRLIAQTEVFGPVPTVLKTTSGAEAIEIANGTDYGLVGGIFTADIDTAHRAARQIRAGQIFINEWFAGGVETPFGGYGKSGYGREKGREALWNYVQTKNIAYRTR
jgi:acyl-CoA reductase-like NAD-dependent aldehyde dehydrogenase